MTIVVQLNQTGSVERVFVRGDNAEDNAEAVAQVVKSLQKILSFSPKVVGSYIS